MPPSPFPPSSDSITSQLSSPPLSSVVGSPLSTSGFVPAGTPIEFNDPSPAERDLASVSLVERNVSQRKRKRLRNTEKYDTRSTDSGPNDRPTAASGRASAPPLGCVPEAGNAKRQPSVQTPEPRIKQPRRRRKPKRPLGKDGASDSVTTPQPPEAVRRADSKPLQPELHSLDDDTLRYDNKGRPLRSRRPPKRLWEELEVAKGLVDASERFTLPPTPTSIESPHDAKEDLQMVEPQRKKKRPELERKLSAPNEHGIVAEEAEKPGSLPLGLSKKRRAPSKVCKSKPITAALLARLGLAGENSLRAGAASKKRSEVSLNSGPQETTPAAKRTALAVAVAASSPPTATEVAEATSKTDDLPPVRAPGIRSSTFASVMRIISGVCPLHSSPRCDRQSRPSLAPPVWAQVSKSGFG